MINTNQYDPVYVTSKMNFYSILPKVGDVIFHCFKAAFHMAEVIVFIFNNTIALF